MIKYICKYCDDLICETSICPVCGKRTEINETIIYWSKKLNTPSFDEYCIDVSEHCEPIGTDLRPVFAEERILLEILEGKPMIYAGKSIWNTGSNRYIIDGKKKIIPFSKYIKESNVDIIIQELEKYNENNKPFIDGFMNQDYIQNFIKINKVRLNTITTEAYEYIQKKAFGWGLDEMFVSFSGGKDSTG